MKLLKSSLLALVAVLMLSTAKPSQAAVGALTANPALALTGLKVTGGGAALLGIGMMAGRADNSMMGMAGLMPGVIGLALAGVGLIILDENQGVSFDELTQEQAQKIGLSSSELEQFNSEIDQVNALASHVDAELSLLSNPSVEDSAAIWASIKDAVSPETFSAMQKISSQL